MIDSKPGWRFVIPCLMLWVSMMTATPLSAQIKPAHKPRLADSQPAAETCVPVASWVIPGKGPTSLQQVIASAVNQSVVLLGESHTSREHHRWQLHMLAAIHAKRPDMMIGFEMFPRRVQAVLDRWVAGELTESEFLSQSEWQTVWGTDASLYLPIFHFARMYRISMLALNIDTKLRRMVTEKGFDGVPENQREGVTRPAPPSPAYLEFLLPIYAQHDRPKQKTDKPTRYDPDFLRFVVGQQLWDRAMAQALHAALDAEHSVKKPLLVGIMGSGHILHGYGVPHQLKDLGVKDILSLLPWDTNRPCKRLVAGYADAVFGLEPFMPEAAPALRQRLGIRYEFSKEAGGARVIQIEKGSIAEIAGLRAGDVIVEMAEVAVKQSEDVVTVVRRQAPGTWLPLKVQREQVVVDVIAKFPAIVNK